MLANPYSHYNELKQTSSIDSIVLSSKLNDYIYTRSTYIKKLLEDVPNLDETIKLMKFLSWENITFSTMLLSELLWMVQFKQITIFELKIKLLFT